MGISALRPVRLLVAALALAVTAAGCSRADRDETPAASSDKGPAT